jgi:DNA-binding GntR family transcriptional regulator
LELEEIHAEQKKAIDAMDMGATSLCNQAFHMFIWDHADNSKMKFLLEQLWNGLSIGTVVLPLVHAKQSYKEHELIIQAIKDKKPGVARTIMKKHIKRSMENMLMRAPKLTSPEE